MNMNKKVIRYIILKTWEVKFSEVATNQLHPPPTLETSFLCRPMSVRRSTGVTIIGGQILVSYTGIVNFELTWCVEIKKIVHFRFTPTQ